MQDQVRRTSIDLALIRQFSPPRVGQQLSDQLRIGRADVRHRLGTAALCELHALGDDNLALADRCASVGRLGPQEPEQLSGARAASAIGSVRGR